MSFAIVFFLNLSEESTNDQIGLSTQRGSCDNPIDSLNMQFLYCQKTEVDILVSPRTNTRWQLL